MPVTVEDIELWDERLRDLTDDLGRLFRRSEPRQTFALMLRAMLADVPKKNSWGLAEHAGLRTPQGFEHLLNGAKWDADELRDYVRSDVFTRLGDAQGALVLDDTQAIKKGSKSVGVAPQHCGLTGQTENCQTMVMLTYASKYGHAYADRELYLTTDWAGDLARRAEAGVPAEREFMTKPQLGVVMLRRALADPALRFRWCVADSGYGRDPALREFCHQQRLPYVMAVPVDLPLVGVRGEALRPDLVLADIPRNSFTRRSAGNGSKGRRTYDWATCAVTVKDQPPADGYAHTLLVRRSKTKKVTKKHPQGKYEIEYFLVHAPIATPVPHMVKAAGLRWHIEDDNKCGKDQLGLDHYQVRKWDPWHRHVTISMLAHAFLAGINAELTQRRQQRRPRDPHQPPSPGAFLLHQTIRYSLAALRILLAAAVLIRANTDKATALARSIWRQQHQTRATISHYQRRGDPHPLIL